MNPKSSIISLIGIVFCISCGEQVKMLPNEESQEFPEQNQNAELTKYNKPIFEFQVETDASILDKHLATSLELEKNIERAIQEEERISIAISIYTFHDEIPQESLRLTRVPWVLPSSKPRSTYVHNYFTRFNQPKNPEYPGTFKAMKKPITVLTAINGLKFVPKSGIDYQGISATFKFVNENIPKQNLRAKWATKLAEKHPAMFRKLAEEANEKNSHVGAFIAKVEDKQYAKIKGNISEMENRFGRTVFGEETWDNLDSKQIVNCGCMSELIVESGDLYQLASRNVEHLATTVLSISKKSYASIGEQLEMFLQNWGFSSKYTDTLNKRGSQNNNLKSPYSFLACRIFKHPKVAP